MYSLVNDHPFTDGNKRTGISAAAIFLRINGYRIIAVSEDLEKITLLTAQGKLPLGEIARWLKEH